MRTFTIDHDLRCTVDQFWETYLDADFIHGMMSEGLRFRDVMVEPMQREPKTGLLRRKVKSNPQLDLPPAVLKLIGDAFGVVETGTFDETTRRFKYEMRFNVLSERMKSGGEIWVEPIGEGRVRRRSENWADVRMIGVQGMMERAIEKNTREGFDKVASYMNRWFDAHPRG